mmetsp:Transcript_667/g.1935  ORF Transcript_667/g.1935 Transcript_667/m.1935 type:complete len:258 (+) Transcript_667:289-1062(+)
MRHGHGVLSVAPLLPHPLVLRQAGARARRGHGFLSAVSSLPRLVTPQQVSTSAQQEFLVVGSSPPRRVTLQQGSTCVQREHELLVVSSPPHLVVPRRVSTYARHGQEHLSAASCSLTGACPELLHGRHLEHPHTNYRWPGTLLHHATAQPRLAPGGRLFRSRHSVRGAWQRRGRDRRGWRRHRPMCVCWRTLRPPLALLAQVQLALRIQSSPMVHSDLYRWRGMAPEMLALMASWHAATGRDTLWHAGSEPVCPATP